MTNVSESDQAALKQRLVDAITSGRQVVIYADLDKTLVPFNSNPDNVQIDRDCYDGLVRLTQFSNVSAMALTGRDAQKARDILTPGHEVTNSAGDIIAAKGTRTLPFPVIASHGTERIDKDGTIAQHDFGTEADDFTRKFKERSEALRNKYKRYGITVEDKKHGSLGINVATIINNAVQQAARADAEQLMNDFANLPENPINPATGQKLFQVKKEGPNEWELRSLGKDFGIQNFGIKSNPNALTIFFCDSLDKDGTDKPAAEFVKRQLPNGTVVQILNERTKSGLADVVFTSPAVLGKFLEDVATTVESPLSPGPKPSSGPSSTAKKRALTKQ